MKKIFFIFTILVIVFSLYQSYNSWTREDSFKVFFFDVGQGDSALIVTPGGKTILIDGGPDDKVLRHLGEVLPFWYRQIDLMIITHTHDDHIIGLIPVSGRYKIKNVLYNNLDFNTPALESLLDVLKNNKIKMISAREGVRFNFNAGCSLNVLASSKELSLDENDYSIVSSFNCLNKKILLTGDAGKYIEDYLVEKKINLSANILKVSHHGSVTASSDNFLKAVNPGQVIISVGQDNKFKHPSLTVLEKFKNMAVDIYRTDKLGTVGFLANNKTIKRVK